MLATWTVAAKRTASLFVAGGEPPVVFEVTEPALDRVAGPVRLGVKGRWPPAARATSGALADLISGGRDGRSVLAPA